MMQSTSDTVWWPGSAAARCRRPADRTPQDATYDTCCPIVDR